MSGPCCTTRSECAKPSGIAAEVARLIALDMLTVREAFGVSMLLIVASASLLGCGGDGSPTGPSGSGVRIILSVPSFGMPISLSVDGQTISAAATQETRLSAGTHTLNGSFTPTGPVTLPQLVISFIGHPAGGGGVRTGSLRSLTGPVLETNPCSIIYTITPSGTTVPQSFSFEFEVTADANSSCPVPGSS